MFALDAFFSIESGDKRREELRGKYEKNVNEKGRGKIEGRNN